MRRLLTFTVGLFLLAVNSWATQKSVVPPAKGKSKMMANLLKRCEDGLAVARLRFSWIALEKRILRFIQKLKCHATGFDLIIVPKLVAGISRQLFSVNKSSIRRAKVGN